MQVSSCCGAQLKEYETPICSCCSEHTDVVKAKRASIEVIDEEYNWPKYSEKIVKERIKMHGSITNAIVEMDAQIASLKIKLDVLNEMVDWDKVEEE